MITLFHGSFLSVEKPLVGVGRHELVLPKSYTKKRDYSLVE